MKKYLTFLSKINLKTLYFNFKYFPFRQAIKLPVFVSNTVYLRETEGKILFECPMKTGLVKIGYGRVGIFDKKNSRGIWEVSGKVIFKGRANIGHGAKISIGNEASLILGDSFTITAETTIIAASVIQFGTNCLLSWDILIMDTDFHKIKDQSGKIINAPRPIIVGDNVWIGCRNLILKGAKIPSNSVIGANSITSKELEIENGLYVGNPAKCIKENITWER